MTPPAEFSGPPISPWFRSFWRIVAVFWLVLLGIEGRALLGGDPEMYLHQHLQGVLVELAGLLLALSFLASQRALRWSLMAGASAAAAVDVAIHLLAK